MSLRQNYNIRNFSQRHRWN